MFDVPNPRLVIVDLSDPVNPAVVGEWQDDPQVSLMSLSINAKGTRAYLSGIPPPPYGSATEKLFLYVLDIQNPGNPVEIGRYVRPATCVHTPQAVPNESDSLVIFADGRWDTYLDAEAMENSTSLKSLI